MLFTGFFMITTQAHSWNDQKFYYFFQNDPMWVRKSRTRISINTAGKKFKNYGRL